MNAPREPESAEIPRTIVVAGVIVRDGKILVVKNVKKGVRIEPPGGKWEQDREESLEEAVVRELAEEVQVLVATREFIGAYDTDSKEADIVVHTFLCELLAGEPEIAPAERHKLAECFWATPDELDAMPELTKSLRSALPALRTVIAREA
jgi:8-oxo-dGTP diphosphatase